MFKKQFADKTAIRLTAIARAQESAGYVYCSKVVEATRIISSAGNSFDNYIVTAISGEGSEIFSSSTPVFERISSSRFVRRWCWRKVIRNLLKPLSSLVPHRMDGQNLSWLSSVAWLHARNMHTTAWVQVSSGMARLSVRTRWALVTGVCRAEYIELRFFTQLIDPLFIHQQFAAPIAASRTAIVWSPEHVDAKLAGWARTAHR